MTKGKQNRRNHMTLNYAFTGIRIVESQLIPVDWELSIRLYTLEKKLRSYEEHQQKAGIAYQKLYFWLDTNLPNIVILNVNNNEDLCLANLSSNIMMYAPAYPGDDVIIQMLHAKATSLVGNDLVVGEMTLKSSDSILSYTFDCHDKLYALPTNAEEYYSEHKLRHKTAWWHRDDGFCFEFICPDDHEGSVEELFKDVGDPMDEFRRLVEDTEGTNLGIPKEPAKIVQIEKWKPKIA
jgi:hypothetical protein